jgi:hypothetical protein
MIKRASEAGPEMIARLSSEDCALAIFDALSFGVSYLKIEETPDGFRVRRVSPVWVQRTADGVLRKRQP